MVPVSQIGLVVDPRFFTVKLPEGEGDLLGLVLLPHPVHGLAHSQGAAVGLMGTGADDNAVGEEEAQQPLPILFLRGEIPVPELFCKINE